MSNFFPDPKKYSTPKAPKGLKQKVGKPTGELALFKKIFLKYEGKCQITGSIIDFHPISFMHILSKGGYPKFRLYEKNILMVVPDIHLFYDNGSMEYLLVAFPKAKIIYELKEKLKSEYHQ